MHHAIGYFFPASTPDDLSDLSFSINWKIKVILQRKAWRNGMEFGLVNIQLPGAND